MAKTIRIPAKVKRTGALQLSVTFDERQGRDLERIRDQRGMRSWGQVIRFLVAEESARLQYGEKARRS